MPRKSAFSASEKLKAVMRFKNGTESLSAIARDLGVDFQTIRNWCRLYESLGMDGLENANHNTFYDEEFKRKVADIYFSGGVSQAEVCEMFGIRAIRTLQRWLEEYNKDEDPTEESRANPAEAVDFTAKAGTSDRRFVMPKKMPVTHTLRLDAVAYCVENGWNYGKTARKFGVSYSQVYSWVKKYEISGADGLVDRRGRRKNSQQMDELEVLRAENRMLKAQNEIKDIEIEALKKVRDLERGWG